MKSLKFLFIAIVILVTASPVFAGYTFTEKPSMFPIYTTISSSLYNRKPVFVDLDNDGDEDLVVGCNDGSLKYLENTGTASSPAWRVDDNKFAGISVSSYASPTFADLDGDGDLDLIIGDLYGNLKYYKNIGTKTNPIFSYNSSMFAGITVGNKASPTFADLDNDGDLDMIVGDDSSIKYYQNTGTATIPAWPLVPVNLSGVSPWTNNSPIFADMDNDGDFDLILACRGGLYYYKNTGTKNSPIWSSDWSAISGISPSYSDDNGVAAADLDNDGDNDLLLGAGDFSYYLNIGSASSPSWTRSDPYILGFDVGYMSTPAFADINNDGLQDVYIGNSYGTLTCFINKGTKTNPAWAIDNTKVATIDVGNYASPVFADLDGDGKQDLVIGEYYGELKYFKNTGTVTSPCWTADNNMFLGIDAGSYSAPTFADLDNDGDLDLVIGESNGGIKYYKNTGTKTNPSWQSETNLFSSVNAYYYSRPSFADVDKDGDLDLIIGNGSGSLKFYENIGTAATPKFKENSSAFPGSGFGSNAAPAFADIDNDGSKEAVIGNYYGTLACYDISFADTTGPEINTAYYEITSTNGQYTISWDTANDSSGISCYELQETTSSSFYGSYTTLSNNISATSFQVTAKPYGIYTYQLRAKDGVGNWGNYKTICKVYSASTTGVDLSLSPSDLVVESNDKVTNGDAVKLHVTVRNNGTRDATATLKVYAGGKDNANLFSSNTVSVYQLSNATYNVYWYPYGLTGKQNIYFVLESISPADSNNSNNEAVKSLNVINLVRPTLCYPSPFNPAIQATKFAYRLDRDMDIQIIVFDVAGRIVWRKTMARGMDGAKTGFNEVEWTGITDFSETAKNGLYIYKILDNSSKLPLFSGKVMVLK